MNATFWNLDILNQNTFVRMITFVPFPIKDCLTILNALKYVFGWLLMFYGDCPLDCIDLTP
jgi:hypothetical protein